MVKEKKIPIVFFNASVILAGLKSPKGGSAKLIGWCQENKIGGVISELVLDEVEHNLDKLSITKKKFTSILLAFKIRMAPTAFLINKYKKVVVDYGDAHIIASAKEVGASFLVSLDKKHILSLREKMRGLRIISPKELIQALS